MKTGKERKFKAMNGNYKFIFMKFIKNESRKETSKIYCVPKLENLLIKCNFIWPNTIAYVHCTVQ